LLLPVAQPQPGGMYLRKTGLPRWHDPAKLKTPLLLDGCMTLQIDWLHDPAKTSLLVAA
jgi:hypothetical protein